MKSLLNSMFFVLGFTLVFSFGSYCYAYTGYLYKESSDQWYYYDTAGYSAGPCQWYGVYDIANSDGFFLQGSTPLLYQYSDTCNTGYVRSWGSLCVTPTSAPVDYDHNGVMDNGETGIDCGGSTDVACFDICATGDTYVNGSCVHQTEFGDVYVYDPYLSAPGSDYQDIVDSLAIQDEYTNNDDQGDIPLSEYSGTTVSVGTDTVLQTNQTIDDSGTVTTVTEQTSISVDSSNDSATYSKITVSNTTVTDSDGNESNTESVSYETNIFDDPIEGFDGSLVQCDGTNSDSCDVPLEDDIGSLVNTWISNSPFISLLNDTNTTENHD